MNKKTRVLSTVLVEPSATKVHNVRWLQIHKPGDWYPVEFWNGTEFHLNKWLADELEFHYDNKDYALIVNQWLPEGERRAEMTLLHKSGVPTKVNKTKLECEF